jgi:hypothetical protein
VTAQATEADRTDTRRPGPLSRRELRIVSWVVTAYLLTSTAVTRLWGKLPDVYGPRNTFQAAIAIFLGGSMLSGPRARDGPRRGRRPPGVPGQGRGAGRQDDRAADPGARLGPDLRAALPPCC